MFEAVEKAGKQLRDPKGTWVQRRDAAEALGQVAAYALRMLKAHEEEMDVDVARSVNNALATARSGLEGVDTSIPEEGYSLRVLARACERPGKREVREHEDGYLVEVKMDEGRKQLVYIVPHERRDKLNLLRVYTYCGKPAEKTARWALRANMKLIQCALALHEIEGEEQIVLTNCFLREYVTPEAIRAAVKEIAFYGDWVEKQLSDVDEH